MSKSGTSSRRIARSHSIRNTLLCAVSVFGLLGSQALAEVHPSTGPTAADRKALAVLEVASVSDHELGKMRGGFHYMDTDVNFGLYTATAINGTVVHENFVSTYGANPGDVAHHLQQIVQNGPNNSAPSSDPNGSPPFHFEGPLSLVQNTLSNTVIQHLTALSVDVTGAHMQTEMLHTNLSRSINNSMMLHMFQ